MNPSKQPMGGTPLRQDNLDQTSSSAKTVCDVKELQKCLKKHDGDATKVAVDNLDLMVHKDQEVKLSNSPAQLLPTL
jgi:hypothetical protein